MVQHQKALESRAINDQQRTTLTEETRAARDGEQGRSKGEHEDQQPSTVSSYSAIVTSRALDLA